MGFSVARNAVFMIGVALAAACGDSQGAQDSSSAPLQGVVQSPDGEPLGGVPVRARHSDTNIATVVYTNRSGEFRYRGLADGSYEISVAVPGFHPSAPEKVSLTGSKATRLDLKLQPTTPSLDEMTSGELLAALPGTEEQKADAARCSNCHTLQFALQRRRDRPAWLQTIERMRGMTPEGVMLPQPVVAGILKQTRESNQRLADFLASVAGPDSPEIPRKLLPRPTSDASTQLTITEYPIPRGAVAVTFRGDPKGAWIHDVRTDPRTGYAWYTDHFANVLGRLDPRTGQIKEFPYPHSKPGKKPGALELNFDRDGNIWLGVIFQGTVAKFDPKTEEFTQWTLKGEDGRFGMVSPAPDGFVWVGTGLFRLDPKTGEFKKYTIPTPRGSYGSALDSKGLIYYASLEGGKIGRFDTRTEQFQEWDPPTPRSGPRRLQIDAQDRFWFAEFYAGNLGLFDPQTETIREWAVPGMPYAAPYDVAVDNREGAVWLNDFNNNRLFRFDIKTEAFTEFLMPEVDVEIRDLFVDETTTPATVWIPDYSPPGKILKLELGIPRRQSGTTP